MKSRQIKTLGNSPRTYSCNLNLQLIFPIYTKQKIMNPTLTISLILVTSNVNTLSSRPKGCFVVSRNLGISDIFFQATQTEVQAMNIITRTQIYKPELRLRSCVGSARSWDSLSLGLGCRVLIITNFIIATDIFLTIKPTRCTNF
jgi:hypothetical protein